MQHHSENITTSTTPVRRRVGHRAAIVVAGVAGFVAGGVGLVAAGQAAFDDNPSPSDIAADVAPSVSVDDTPSPTVVTVSVAPSVTSDDDSASSTPVTVDDDSTSSSPSVSVAPSVTVDDHGGDRSDDRSDDDSASSSSEPSVSVPSSAPLPAPFTETYTSAGGSITVTWSGTAFTLDSVVAADGFEAVVEDLRWDRVRVDFEGERDARIEVRLSDDDHTIRVGID